MPTPLKHPSMSYSKSLQVSVPPAGHQLHVVPGNPYAAHSHSTAPSCYYNSCLAPEARSPYSAHISCSRSGRKRNKKSAAADRCQNQSQDLCKDGPRRAQNRGLCNPRVVVLVVHARHKDRQDASLARDGRILDLTGLRSKHRLQARALGSSLVVPPDVTFPRHHLRHASFGRSPN